MIDALLGKVSGLFEKDFWFASFLPGLIFAAALLATFAWVVGLDAMWAQAETLTVIQQATGASLGALLLVVFAYLLTALRSVFLRLWSGAIRVLPFLPFVLLGETAWRLRYLRRREAVSGRVATRLSDWFRDEVDRRWDDARPDAPAREAAALLHATRGILSGMTAPVVRRRLRPIVEAYDRFNGNSLGDVYLEAKRALADWDREEEVRLGTRRARLDRLFGSLESIRATRLGNLIQAYELYPFTRYRMEAEVFWPRLRHVMKPAFLALVQEQRILLDFCLTMATLGLAYGALLAVATPWVWWDSWLYGLAALGFVASLLFYRLSLTIADHLGDLVRASFDLFRLDLMAALHRTHPATLEAERRQWEQLSQLMMYGTVADFDLRPRQPPPRVRARRAP